MSGTRLVVAGIFVRAGRLLLARRRAGGPHAGLWELPGGKVRPDESPEDALAREWSEELDALPAGLVPEGFARDGDVTLLFFRVRALLGEPRPVQCEAVRWCRADEARLLAMPPADGPAIERLASSGAFRDTEDSGTPGLLGEARERLPFIEGSEALSPGAAVRFRKQRVGGRPALDGVLVDTPSGPRAYENLCPHVPIPLDRIADDIVSADGGYLVCQNHRAVFELPSGRCVSGPCEGEALREIPIERTRGGWAVLAR